MQNELTALRPQLLETSDETERLMIKIEQDTIQVEAKKEIVACDEALANEAAAAAQAIRDDCENDLAEAIPALQSAVTSLDTLNANDITVVKTMKNPAPIVKFVVEAVCVMKGVSPDRKPGEFCNLNLFLREFRGVLYIFFVSYLFPLLNLNRYSILHLVSFDFCVTFVL